MDLSHRMVLSLKQLGVLAQNASVVGVHVYWILRRSVYGIPQLHGAEF